MADHDLEERVAELEKRFSALESRFQRVWEKDAVRVLKIELSVERIDERLKEYDMVRAAAFGGYFATHPEAREDLAKLDDLLGTSPPEPKK